MKPIRSKTRRILGRVAFTTVIAIPFCPYWLVASPKSTIHLYDDAGHPLSDITVVRRWETSENLKGQESAITDATGTVSFPKQRQRISLLWRMTKPLFAFVPASCGPSFEFYNETEFHIQPPKSPAFTGFPAGWTVQDSRQLVRNHVWVSNPVSYQPYLKIEAFNEKRDFDFTLPVRQ